MKHIALFLLMVLAMSCRKDMSPFNFKPRKGKSTTDKLEPIVRLSDNVIFLDFNGDSTYGVFGDIHSGPTSLSKEDRQTITDSVTKYFAMFNVSVITNEHLLVRAKRKIHVVITDDYWPGLRLGGIADVGGFTRNSSTPCYVFPPYLFYNIQVIGVEIAHEIGHFLGLVHQSLWNDECQRYNEFNEGTDTEAPIMGKCWGKTAKWWVGSDQYSCSEIQNDAEIIRRALQ